MKVRRSVNDLGVAAYVKMHGYPCAGKKGRNYFFDIEEKDLNDFERLVVEYVNSPMHDFDHHIMSLKKMNDYLPDDDAL